LQFLAILTRNFSRLLPVPGNRAYCDAELAVSSLAVAVTIASITHFAHTRRDYQATLAWVASRLG